MSVHPRASGERPAVVPLVALDVGSSPRERGTHDDRRPHPPLDRFIPARAGNAPSSARPRSLGPVHPRASGERQSYDKEMTRGFGSSPRERGTRSPTPARRWRPRFIPARAGNAAARRCRLSGRTVHPRASGERLRSELVTRYSGGSSPRERGTHHIGQLSILLERFIPARAGNARSQRRVWTGAPVHPRASGERCCRRRGVCR